MLEEQKTTWHVDIDMLHAVIANIIDVISYILMEQSACSKFNREIDRFVHRGTSLTNWIYCLTTVRVPAMSFHIHNAMEMLIFYIQLNIDTINQAIDYNIWFGEICRNWPRCGDWS